MPSACAVNTSHYMWLTSMFTSDAPRECTSVIDQRLVIKVGLLEFRSFRERMLSAT